MAKEKPLVAGDLVREYIKWDDWLKKQQETFDEKCGKPATEAMAKLKDQMLELMNQQKTDKFPTKFGTCYKSNIMNLTVQDREKLLDFCNENWDAIGSEMLMINAKKDAVKEYMENNNGKLPPGVKTEFITRVNVRRSA
jgi:hypothetical protein